MFYSPFLLSYGNLSLVDSLHLFAADIAIKDSLIYVIEAYTPSPPLTILLYIFQIDSRGRLDSITSIGLLETFTQSKSKIPSVTYTTKQVSPTLTLAGSSRIAGETGTDGFCVDFPFMFTGGSKHYENSPMITTML